jgi:hypothetical protein
MLVMPDPIPQTLLNAINRRNYLNLSLSDVTFSAPGELDTVDGANTRVYVTVAGDSTRTYPVLYTRLPLDFAYGPHSRAYTIATATSLTTADILALVNARLHTALEASAFVDQTWVIGTSPTTVTLTTRSDNLLFTGAIGLTLTALA